MAKENTATRTPKQIQGEINAFKQLLTNSDYIAIKHSEDAISDEEYLKTKELRASYREQINQLERELENAE